MNAASSAPALRALARARAYGLLGDLFARGLTAESLAAWRQIEGGILGDEVVDLAAAGEAHTRLLLLEVPAFEGFYLSPEGTLGGDVAASVRDARGRAGLGEPREGEVESVAEQLRWLAFLAGAEADALRDGIAPEPLHELAREALDLHLLAWVPGWASALEGAAFGPVDSLFVRASALVLAVALDHRNAFGGAPGAVTLPAVLDLLADERAGLAAIGRHLATPCQAGGAYTRPFLGRIGRALELPAGFGSRADILENLLRSAAHYDRVGALAEALSAETLRWDTAWEGFAAAGVWRERTAGTRALLGRLAEGARLTASNG